MSTIDIYNEELMHYGTPRHSGRYPWGSGDNPYQHEQYGFLHRYRELENEGLSQVEIARSLGITTTELRKRYSIAINSEKAALKARAYKLKEHGYSNVEIGKKMGIPDTTIGNWLNERDKKQEKIAETVADILINNVDSKGFIDVGSGVELEMREIMAQAGKDMGVSKDRLNTAVELARQKGYEVIDISIEQVTNPGKYITMKILAPPGTTKADVYNNLDKVQSVTDYVGVDGKSVHTLKYPESISSDRVFIRYAEDGGKDKDGTIELRRGVDDISMGSSSYAQVRVAVDGKYYMKGMAFYSDDIPEGYDIVYNSNKPLGSSQDKVFKKMNLENPDNPFGALIKAKGQMLYPDPNGKYIDPETGEKASLSVINKIKEEGDWDHYKKSLSSQMLSKQSTQLIDRQLNLTYADKKAEYDEIMSLNNKEIKVKLLEEFAAKCDRSAEHLDAAALPRQSTKVILPIPSLKDNEIYAPTYKEGETVVLIRYPHGGTFEIPELKVTTKNPDADKIIGKKAIDAVGINSKVAARLSGADFDGDTVVVIPANGPNSKIKIKTSKPLEQLKGFDPGIYEKYEGMKVLPKSRVGTEMGVISNLITDMTIQKASPEELARAVKHSMVVIDAHKHELNYKLSEEQNGIAALHKKYQGKVNGGAASLISRASSKPAINEAKQGSYTKDGTFITYSPDKNTGKWIFKETGRTYDKPITTTKTTVDSNGNKIKQKFFVREDGGLDAERQKGVKYKTKPVKYQTRSYSRMDLTDDARTLISTARTQQEISYANFANKLKSLANTARKEAISMNKAEKVNPKAKETYAMEVASLKSKLNNSLKNAPKERLAQIKATKRYNSLKDEQNMDKDDLKKLKQQSITIARAQVGASKKDVEIEITDREWEAIQNHAVSSTTLRAILNNTNTDKVRQRAMPKTNNNTVSSAKQAQIKAMSASGYTLREISDRLGIPMSTVSTYTKGE